MNQDLEDLFENEENFGDIVDDLQLIEQNSKKSISASASDNKTHNDITEKDIYLDFKFQNTIAQENIPGFDNSFGATYIYPTNYPVRDYQFNIIKKALLNNTLVVLPTGLGKTFIAAVVMYNFYRWYPRGKLIFMAPTKPLVAQQIDACYKIMGIPYKDTIEMTGNVYKRKPAVLRFSTWCKERLVIELIIMFNFSWPMKSC